MADAHAAGSGSQATGTKRRRVDSGDDSQTQAPPPEKYKELQFDDASIVLQCPTASFRVHRSILVAHSEVFRDMFTLAQSGDKEDGTGVPVVHVSDDAEKMYNLLTTLYFSTRPNPEDARYFSRLLDTFELSRKYAIKTVSDRCKETMQSIFPDKLQDYVRAHERRNAICSQQDSLLRCIALAKAHRLRTDTSIAITLYSGRHNLTKLKRDVVDVHIRKYVNRVAHVDGFHCGAKLAKALFNRLLEPRVTNSGVDYLDEVELFVSDSDLLAADTTVGAEKLCDGCREAWRVSEREGMVEAWEKMPDCFYLGTWEELRKEDESESSQDEEETEGGAATDNGDVDEVA